ncbi:MAG: hypothetical protein HOO86_06120 [Bacteroidales bacterium]|nr:hypothetical protein [Bacteroidales bacterium]
MNKFAFLLLFVFLSLIGQNQERFQGVVLDAGTREGLSNVVIQSSITGLTTMSDVSGLFTISVNPAIQNQDTSKSLFSVINNSLIWDVKEAVTIHLYSLNGAELFNASLPNSGRFHLPVPIAGYYLLYIYSTSQPIKFFLFSDATNLHLIRPRTFPEPTPVFDSSLYFYKPGYFTREVLLNETEGQFRVNLLKKEYDDLDYFNELLRHEAFYMLHSSPPTSNYGEIQSIKAFYDFVEDEIYYSNLKKYPSHFSFAESVLKYPYGSTNFFWTQYNISPWRFLNLVTINYHERIDKYVFEFDSWDRVDCDGIKATYDKIMETSFFKDKLYFYANNLQWKDCQGVPVISAEELYLGQNYQALNPEENYGFLRKVDINELNDAGLSRHDLILLNGIPNDVPVVSGIITTEFQTALSHINILSHNRHTPNMVLKDGWTNPKLDSLTGELVYLKVESDSFYIRKANIVEATAFWDEREPRTPVILEKDVMTSGLVELQDEDIFSVKTIGGKAANFAELVKLDSIPLPENYFAIPFYYYQQHIISHGIDTIIRNMLNDDTFVSNAEYRKVKLEELRDIIVDSPLDAELSTAVLNRINYFEEFNAYKFRSSTNAEDLEGFSGAGLYDSYAAKKGDAGKTVDRAIKKVWASLWNSRAFDEREYYKIDQNSVAMGILVHRSFTDEDANGVIITRNLYNDNHGYTINTQYKEYSIVYPEPGIMHDQIITYTINLENLRYTIEYLSKSNIPDLDGKTVLTDDELIRIADYCTAIKQHYYNNIQRNCHCDYSDFAVDIEFKVDSQVEDRKIYIKQARIFETE